MLRSALIALMLLATPRVHADENDDLIDFVFSRNEAAMQKIKTLSYTSETKVDEQHVGERPYRDTITKRYIRDGQQERLFQIRKVMPQTMDGKPLPPEKVDDRTIVSDSFVAHFQRVIDPPGPFGSVATWFGHHSIDEMSKASKDDVAWYIEEDEVMQAFGAAHPGETFRSFYKDQSKFGRFEMKKVALPDNKRIYQLNRYFASSKGPEYLQGRWEFDPDCDYLLIHFIAFAEKGGVVWEDRLAPKAIGPEHVFIAATSSRTIDENQLKHHHTTILSDVKVNQEIDDSVFGFDQLEVPEGTSVVRRDADGHEVNCVYHNGAIVPRRLVPFVPPPATTQPH